MPRNFARYMIDNVTTEPAIDFQGIGGSLGALRVIW
jgi:hypothetical protein